MYSIYRDIVGLEDNEKELAQFVTDIVLRCEESPNHLTQEVKQQIRKAIQSFKHQAEDENESLTDLLESTLKSTCCQ